ncbi:MAG TPA: Dabb family protein [Thermoguttaceae bacterium]|nr:Dabb family protein [Thermoguttaceae bacterium]HPP52169.1 Dabb family protein [Thermoguttaceae bacterium]
MQTMKKVCWVFVLGCGAAAGWWVGQSGTVCPAGGEEAPARALPRYLVHDVYFTLKDKTPEAQAAFVESCKKYLSGHKDTVWFAAGVRAGEFQRPVNDQEFDVALQVVFKDKSAHDTYQEHPRHLKFIEENKDRWSKVRVCDWYMEASDHGAVLMQQK